MTRKSRREIEQQLNDIGGSRSPEERLKEAWVAGLKGEDMDMTAEEWTILIEEM